jgi:hypothetical protein
MKYLAVMLAMLMATSASCLANDIVPPVGFADLYERQEMVAKFYIGDSDFIEASIEGTFDSVFLAASEKDKLTEFMKLHFVDEASAERFSEELVNGMTSSEKCVGSTDSCQFISSRFDIVYSQDDQFVRLFISPELMSTQNGQKQYISDKVGRSALISSSDVYASLDRSANSSLTWNNLSTLHMMGGQFFSDFSSSTTGDNKLEYNEFSYTYAIPKSKVQLGYFGEDALYAFNSTLLLADDSRYNQLALKIGSSNELERDNKENSKRLYFSSPSAGRVQVLKGDKIILSENAVAGQNFISFYRLPKGNYDAIIRVYVGDKVILEEHRKIYNNNDYNLAVGEMDYQFTLGKFMGGDSRDTSDEMIHQFSDEFDEPVFLRSDLAYKLSEGTTLAAGLLNSRNSWYAKAALKFDFNENFSTHALYGQFDNSSNYSQAGVRLYNISVDWSQYNDRGDNTLDELDNYLFGFGSNNDISASYYQPIGTGNAYVTYTKGKGILVTDYIFNEDNGLASNYESYSAGYTFHWLADSTIDINVGYNKNETFESDYTFGLNVSIPITTKASISMNAYTGRSGGSSFRTAYTRDELMSSKNASLSGEVGVSYDGYQSTNMATDLSVNGSYNNELLTSNAYAYVDSRGEAGLNGGLHTTQVVTSNNIFSTADRADSYLLVKNTSLDSSLSEKSDRLFSSVVKVKRNGDPEADVILDHDVKLYPLTKYKEYQVSLDMESSDYYNNGESSTIASSYPGTLVNLDVDLHEVRSYISIFNDLEGRAIDTVTCKGVGCVSVEELSDGVFKFKVRMGMPYELQANNQRCLIPNLNMVGNHNLGENFCMPQFDIDDEGYQIAKGSDKNFYYVGEYDDKGLMKKLIAGLQDEPFEFITKTVGNREFLFLKLDGFLTAEQGSKLDAMKAYAIEAKPGSTYVLN